MLTTADILGVRVHSGATSEIIAHLDHRLVVREVTRVAFLNAHLSNICWANGKLRRRLEEFFVLNDGIGVELANRLLYGQSFPENLNGTDFVPAYLEHTKFDLRLFLLGAENSVLNKAAKVIEQRWPRHTIVGTHHGYFDDTEAPLVRESVEHARPDLVLVGLSSPGQELWIANNIPDVGSHAEAVGALFDFMAEAVPRAPIWVRRIHGEWAFRLFREPRRLARRYLLGNPVFLARIAMARLRLNAAASYDGVG